MSGVLEPLAEKLFSFESGASDALGVSVPQLRFAIALLASVPVAAGIRLLRNVTVRHLYALVSGVLLVYYPFGMGISQVVLPLSLTYGAMALAPHICGYIAWLNMAYLIWLHVENASGEAWSQGQMDFTGGSMVIVLKLLSLAMCRQDAARKKDLNQYQMQHKVERLPNPVEYLGYAFCCGNLLAGPYMEFSEYLECLEEKGHWALQRERKSGYVKHGLRKVVESILSMVAMLYMEPRFGPVMLRAPWYKEQPVGIRLLLHWLAGVVCQLRYSFVWLLSEASLTFMGLNLKGWDDKGRPLWGLCANVNFIGVQLSESARALPLSWNTCTGRFLRRYVYDRLTPTGKRPGFPQLLATQLVSGFWHGLYPGYLLFFASSALMFQASTGIARLEALTLPDWVLRTPPVRLLHIAITGIMLDHLALAFVLLDLKRGIDVFRDVYFIPHIFMTVMTVLALVLPDAKRKKQKEQKEKEEKAK